MHLRFSTVLALTLASFLTSLDPAPLHGASPYGTPHPDAPSALHQFAFLIGPWDCDVEWPRPDGTVGRGDATWTGRWILDGRAIQDDFRGGFAEGYLATTFRAWDGAEEGWRGFWLDAAAGRWSRPLVEEPAETGLRLRTSQTFRTPEGETIDVELRYHFHRIVEDAFSWRQDSSRDGGATWTEGTTRIECRRPTDAAATAGD